MFGIGLGEILLIILIIFIISPKDLPKAMKKLAQFFNVINKLKDEIANLDDNVKDIINNDEIADEVKKIDNDIYSQSKNSKDNES